MPRQRRCHRLHAPRLRFSRRLRFSFDAATPMPSPIFSRPLRLPLICYSDTPPLLRMLADYAMPRGIAPCATAACRARACDAALDNINYCARFCAAALLCQEMRAARTQVHTMRNERAACYCFEATAENMSGAYVLLAQFAREHHALRWLAPRFALCRVI